MFKKNFDKSISLFVEKILFNPLLIFSATMLCVFAFSVCSYDYQEYIKSLILESPPPLSIMPVLALFFWSIMLSLGFFMLTSLHFFDALMRYQKQEIQVSLTSMFYAAMSLSIASIPLLYLRFAANIESTSARFYVLMFMVYFIHTGLKGTPWPKLISDEVAKMDSP